MSRDGTGSVDRRHVLAGAAALMAAAAGTTTAAATPPVVPSAGAGAADDGRRAVDPASGDSLLIAQHVAGTPFEALSPAALTLARRSLLDALGVSMAAAGLEPACAPFIEQAVDEGAGGRAVVLGTGLRSSMTLAALANGALAHALDYEDAHDPSRTHPNAATVAAAISVASARPGITGREFISAVAIGCDLTCRLSMAQGRVDVLPKAWYPPAIVGTFGATAAAARLLGLTPQQVLDAFSLALCQNSCSAEILSDAYSDIRAIRDGPCAQAGVQAALLARRGVKGFSRPFEGERGFFAMYADGACIPGLLTQDLGHRWEGEAVGFKAWSACRDNHPYIQAVLEGLRAAPLDLPQIERVQAFVPRRSLIVCEPADEKRRPRAAIDAKFSLYYTVAAALHEGAITLGSYSPAMLQRPAVLQLADRIHYTVDDARATRPAADGRLALLELRMRDGTVRHWGIGALYGSPANPMSEQTLVDKFIDCGRAARRPRSTPELQRLAQRLLAIEAVKDMQEITRWL